jgi:2-polyprenyl-3-methyl-5-hydroxy-6-metoxy-1,4-benzoquinol methylase
LPSTSSPSPDAAAALGAPFPPCRLCGAAAARALARLEGYTVLRCRSCGFVYSDLPAERIPGLYDSHYFEQEFGPYFDACFGKGDAAPLRARFEVYARLLAEHHAPGAALDVGCAAGLFMEVLAEHGWRPTGVEVSEHAAEAARARTGFQVHAGAFEDVALAPGAFDAVALLDVIEHLADPGAALRRARALLAPDGLLLLVLPNDRNLTTLVARALYRASGGRIRYPASRTHQIYHVSYFTPRTLRVLLEREGFEIVARRPDETVVGLLNEPWALRLAVGALFAISRILRLENKMLVLARPRV